MIPIIVVHVREDGDPALTERNVAEIKRQFDYGDTRGYIARVIVIPFMGAMETIKEAEEQGVVVLALTNRNYEQWFVVEHVFIFLADGGTIRPHTLHPLRMFDHWEMKQILRAEVEAHHEKQS